MADSRMKYVTIYLMSLAVFFAAPRQADATHYPNGALCYDCHAVSKDKMISGTYLIKKSSKTNALGMSAADTNVRCLFCHDERAVSLETRDRMKGVWDHFNSNSLSKHGVDVNSSFDAVAAGSIFDCLDCHDGISQGVEPDGQGNANIHGKNAAVELLNVYETLKNEGAPTPLTAAGLMDNTCKHSACHGGPTGNAYGGKYAPKAHSFTAISLTLNDGAAPTDCMDCHGTHNSMDGEKLLTLLNTSGANNKLKTDKTVKLNECEVCHTQDENGATRKNNFSEFGHGKVGITCDVCHDDTHDPNGDHIFDSPRLRVPEENAPLSTFTGESFYSNCRNCHRNHGPHNGPTDPNRAGCRDCHDQHGKYAADDAFANDTMVRRIVQGQESRMDPMSGVRNRYDGEWYRAGDTLALCDNESCHSTLLQENGVDPLYGVGQTLLNVHQGDAGGPSVLGSCNSGVGCHATHTSPKVGQGYGCDQCHADNNRTHSDANESNATHQLHINNVGYIGAGQCQRCHSHNGFTMPPGVLDHNNGTVDFTAVTGYIDSSLSYNGNGFPNTNCSAENSCHDSDVDEWKNGNLGPDKCVDCHASGAKLLGLQVGGVYPPVSNKHANHLTSAALPQPTDQEKCFSCHNTTVDSSGQIVAGGTHVNGSLDATFNANYDYAGVAAARIGSGATTTCQNIKCHNGDSTPAWDAASTIACGDCHGTGGPLPDDAATTGSHLVHANNDAVYTECAKCHPGADTYTADGGNANHQNLIVNIVPYDLDNNSNYTDATGGGGINHSGDGIDNGTCLSTYCHVLGEPTWGNAGSVVCGDCHGTVGRTGYLDATGAVDGAPAVDMRGLSNSYEVGKHLNHVNESWIQTGNTSSCNLCHNGAGYGTALHADGTVDIAFHPNASPAATPGSATFNDQGTGVESACTNLACHIDALWDPNNEPGCRFCHGYPPVTTANDPNNIHPPGVTPVHHSPYYNDGGIKVLGGHNQCGACHGNLDDGTGNHKPYVNSNDTYSVATDHRDGNIEMNGPSANWGTEDGARYDEGNLGCDKACHDNDANHRFAGDSGLPVEYADYGEGSCSGCHGFPPIDASLTPVARVDTPSERPAIVAGFGGYAAGGGAHRLHVNFIWKLYDPAFDPTDPSSVPTEIVDPVVLCGPCHGDAPGAAGWHNEGLGVVQQSKVDIRTRDITNFSWGTNAAYENLDMSSPNQGGQVANNGSRRCENLDCHGKPDPDASTGDGTTQDKRAHFGEELIWEFDPQSSADGTSIYAVSKKTAICKWCHDGTPAQIVLKNNAGNGDVFSSVVAPRVTDSYFRPPSGFGRGGHGDAHINSTDDPTYVDSAVGAAPLDCTDCHDETTDWSTEFTGVHGPSSNYYRLAFSSIESASHNSSDLCSSCHRDDATYGYPSNHHPSFSKNSQPVSPAVGQEIYTTASSWTEPLPDFWKQNGYSAASAGGNVDFAVDFWGGNPGGSWASPPQPSPYAILPLSGQIDGTVAGNRVMCVTCHNPHGTDLFVDTSLGKGGNYKKISDNNMLRVRDEDMSLCQACH